MGTTNDIFAFNAEYSNEKPVRSEDIKLTVSGTGTPTEYLVQSVNAQYSRSTSYISEISSGKRYVLGGAPEGVLTVSRISGSQSIQSVVGQTGQGAWVGDGATITISPVGGASGPTYSFKGCVITGFSGSTNVQQEVFSEQVTFKFGAMEET